MKILVACEESQRVCKAFRAKGHEAYSCDIIMCSGNAPQWHILSDILPLLNGNCTFRTCDGQSHAVRRWDMIIAFPPCTYLSNAGSVRLFAGGKLNQERYELGLQAASFFRVIYSADCDRICIENPAPIKLFGLPNPTQIIHPYYFGVPVSKRTCLWLKGLPFLTSTNIVFPQYTFLTYPAFAKSGGKSRQCNCSKTFEEVAQAMASAWG